MSQKNPFEDFKNKKKCVQDVEIKVMQILTFHATAVQRESENNMRLQYSTHHH